jgi:hypothetical protein
MAVGKSVGLTPVAEVAMQIAAADARLSDGDNGIAGWRRLPFNVT